jgi:hypothetical protein
LIRKLKSIVTCGERVANFLHKNTAPIILSRNFFIKNI